MNNNDLKFLGFGFPCFSSDFLCEATSNGQWAHNVGIFCNAFEFLLADIQGEHFLITSLFFISKF